MAEPRKIVLAANEDGFGPSAFAFHIIRALFRATDALRVTLLNRGAEAFNRALFSELEGVRLSGTSSLVRLEKSAGEVDLEHLRDYSDFRARYESSVRGELEGAQLSIDIGVPLLARSAALLGVPHSTVFDHSWARTLRGLASAEPRSPDRPPPSPRARDLAEAIASEIEADEATTREVFLFEPYLSPPIFREHYQRLGLRVREIPGVLGGPGDPVAARRKLCRVLEELGQADVPESDRLVLITPGGTPVWNALIPALLDGPRTEGATWVLSGPRLGPEERRRIRSGRGLRWLEPLRGATQQVLLPAFERVISRAGGGIVNDCLATRTPLVAIEEGHWQVEAIERECRARGIIEARSEASLAAFRRDPRGTLEALASGPPPAPPPEVRTGAEDWLARELLRSV